MLFSDKKARDLLSGIFGVSSNAVLNESISIKDSQINRGSVYLYIVDSKKVICKFTTVDNIQRIGQALNSYNEDNYMEMWLKAYPISSLKDSYLREARIYQGIDKVFDKYLPAYYGSFSDGNHCIMFIEYVENIDGDKDYDTEGEMTFLAFLHNTYFMKEEIVRKTGAYIHIPDDFINSCELIGKWMNYIRQTYPAFPEDIMNEIEHCLCDFEIVYQEMLKYGRTLCHGDFSRKNTKISHSQLKVFDWEFASYCNPEFDLINYMVRINNNANNIFFESTIQNYYQQISFRKNFNELLECLKINIKLYFLVRFSGSMVKNSKTKNNRFLTEIENFILLYRFLLHSK